MALFRVKALYEYSSPHEDDLSFPAGAVITVTEEEDDDWYTGEYVDDDGTKQEGLFPRNFVEKFEPTAPPRPTRSRTKKDPEPSQPVAEEADAPAPAPPVAAEEPTEATPRELEPPTKSQEIPEPQASISPVAEPVAVPAQAAAPSEPAVATSKASASAAAQKEAAKPKPPPPVSNKPSNNAFKDRIAAFNKPAAPPVAPFKPTGLASGSGAGSGSSGFIKKPFVAPPPSRNAYVPPPREAPTSKVYRREEDPEIKEKETENQVLAEKAGLVSGSHEGEAPDEGDQPKPTSLKERIALLQKQQMEQAQRHAEAATKKEKPKKPPTKKEKPAEPVEAQGEQEELAGSEPAERTGAEDAGIRTSTDEGEARRAPPAPRRKPSKGPGATESIHDGNEADMSGAGDTTEGHDDTTEREDNDEPHAVTRVGTGSTARSVPPVPSRQRPQQDLRRDEEAEAEKEKQDEDEDEGEGEAEGEEEEEEDVDPEVKRKEELRARMAKMSGGMGFHGMFGAPMPSASAPAKKKKAPKVESATAEGLEEGEEDVASPAATSGRAAPPIPTMMALPGMGGPRKVVEPSSGDDADDNLSPVTRGPPPPVPSRVPEDADDDEEDEDAVTPGPTSAPSVPPRGVPPPPIPGERPLPPAIPAEGRPPPPPPHAGDGKPSTEGSESDDELSGANHDQGADSLDSRAVRSPPMPPPGSGLPRSPPMSSGLDDFSVASATSTQNKRSSRAPPPIPTSAPAVPPATSRPPPPPPPGGVSRQSTADVVVATSRPHQAGEEEEDENAEYEGDYDTDIASSVPHKDALKAHAREDSLEDSQLQSPKADAPAASPPGLPGSVPRGIPPPIPSQPPPASAEGKRRSMDTPRAAPPPPPGGPDASQDDQFNTYNYSAPTPGSRPAYTRKTPKIEEEAYFPAEVPVAAPRQSLSERRPPAVTPGRSTRQSLDVSRAASGTVRRSIDATRPSMESGFIANDLDLALPNGWWKQSNQVPPVLQGRKDLYFESDESTTTNGGARTIVTRELFVLFQDYSQTIITVSYDPYDPSDIEAEQRHEPPPRPLRQDEMEEYYERFGRHISESVASKKDTVVADGSPQGLVFELLRPFRDALMPVGTRAYGALVYANMANASTQQNDAIRPGDIMTIRNAKFQGKHGAMHAKYSAEVGKPDHVAVVAEWDGTKKKVRAWEQGRESKKVKLESFKLDDLRSGEVKIWRVVPRSWLGWSTPA